MLAISGGEIKLRYSHSFIEIRKVFLRKIAAIGTTSFRRLSLLPYAVLLNKIQIVGSFKMSFGSDLRQIFNICHIKIAALSNYLDYDASYISKWISGAKLPAEMNIDQICESIAKYICSDVSEKGLHTLQRLISVPTDAAPEDTVSPLSAYLLASYMRDKPASGELHNFEAKASEHDDATSIMNLGICLERFLRNTLNGTSKEEFEIILSAHTFLGSISFLRSLPKEFPGLRFKMHGFYNPADFSLSIDYCRFVSNVCSHIPEADIDASEVRLPHPEHSDLICIVKNHALLTKAYGVLGSYFPVYTTDLADVNAQYNAIMSVLSKHRFDSYRYGDGQYEQYLFKFYVPKNGASVNMLTNEMLLPGVSCVSDDEFRSNLLKYNNNIERLEWYRSLSNYGEGHIANLYYESAIIDFCRSGIGRAGPDSSEPVVFSPDNRRKLLDEAICSIERGNSSIYILSDINPVFNCRDFNGTISCSSDLLCITPAGSEKVTYIKSGSVVKSFQTMFKDLLDLPENYLLRGEKAAEFLRYSASFITKEA